jgi:hypothetical protein
LLLAWLPVARLLWQQRYEILNEFGKFSLGLDRC